MVDRELGEDAGFGGAVFQRGPVMRAGVVAGVEAEASDDYEDVVASA
jgi:hypothetical protein